jgi:hypothetical protein
LKLADTIYGGMAAIRQTYDDIWAFTVADADDRQ